MKCEICGEAVTELSSTGRPLCQAHKYGMAEPRPAVVVGEPVAPGALPEPEEAKAVRPKANKAVKPAEDK